MPRKKGKTNGPANSEPKYLKLAKDPLFIKAYFHDKMMLSELCKKFRVSRSTVLSAVGTDYIQNIKKNHSKKIDEMMDNIEENCTIALRTFAARQSKKKIHDKDDMSNVIKIASRLSPRFKEKVQHTTLDEDGNEKGIEININFTKPKEDE